MIKKQYAKDYKQSAKNVYDRQKMLYENLKKQGVNKDNDHFANYIYIFAKKAKAIYDCDKASYLKYHKKSKDVGYEVMELDEVWYYNKDERITLKGKQDEGVYIERLNELKKIYEFNEKQYDELINGCNKFYWDM